MNNQPTKKIFSTSHRNVKDVVSFFENRLRTAREQIETEARLALEAAERARLASISLDFDCVDEKSVQASEIRLEEQQEQEVHEEREEQNQQEAQEPETKTQTQEQAHKIEQEPQQDMSRSSFQRRRSPSLSSSSEEDERPTPNTFTRTTQARVAKKVTASLARQSPGEFYKSTNIKNPTGEKDVWEKEDAWEKATSNAREFAKELDKSGGHSLDNIARLGLIQSKKDNPFEGDTSSPTSVEIEARKLRIQQVVEDARAEAARKQSQPPEKRRHPDPRIQREEEQKDMERQRRVDRLIAAATDPYGDDEEWKGASLAQKMRLERLDNRDEYERKLEEKWANEEEEEGFLAYDNSMAVAGFPGNQPYGEGFSKTSGTQTSPPLRNYPASSPRAQYLTMNHANADFTIILITEPGTEERGYWPWSLQRLQFLLLFLIACFTIGALETGLVMILLIGTGIMQN